jgi:colanic acid biosynthesis glycosyl transferase WcaI
VRILLVTQIYLPEMGALANRLYPLVRQLVAQGHEVHVATCMPNYPAGVVFPDYEGKRTLTEVLDGARIHRTACYTAPRNQSRLAQLRSYLSFLPAAFRSGLRAGKVDVVFVTSPPLFPLIAAALLANLRGAKLILDLRDLWPDEIIACGAGDETSLPVRLMRVLERWGYRHADLITCTTPSFMETVKERGASPDRLMFLPNGADLNLFRPLTPDNVVAAAAYKNLEGKFVVLYSGLLGIKHGLETLLGAAELLRFDPDIRFCFLGSGARGEALRDEAKRRDLDNVIFLGERPVTEVPAVLARADVCVSALLPEPYLEKIISVKLFEYMACEKPVIASQAGEGAKRVDESGGGLVTPPGDSKALADAIRTLKSDPERRREMGQSGRRYIESYYSRQTWAERFVTAVEALAQEPESKTAHLPQSATSRS